MKMDNEKEKSVSVIECDEFEMNWVYQNQMMTGMDVCDTGVIRRLECDWKKNESND